LDSWSIGKHEIIKTGEIRNQELRKSVEYYDEIGARFCWFAWKKGNIRFSIHK